MNSNISVDFAQLHGAVNALRETKETLEKMPGTMSQAEEILFLHNRLTEVLENVILIGLAFGSHDSSEDW